MPSRVPDATDSALEVRLLERIAEVPEAEWDALLGPESSPFVEWGFLEALESAGCVAPERGWLPRHLAVRRGERLVAAVPAYVKGNSEGEFVFDHSWAGFAERRLRIRYYPKLIFAVPFTPVTGDRVLVAPGEDRAALTAAIASVGRRVVDELELSGAHLLFPREDEQAAFVDQGFVARAGVQWHWRNEGFRTFEDFLGTLPSKRRTQIRRERRELRDAGITLETRRGAAIDDETLALAYRYYLSTVDKFVWGRRYLNEEFFRTIRDRWAEKGALEVVIARDAGRPIAGAINVQKAGRLYGRYWGAEEDRRFLHFEVCYYHSIEEGIARGLSAFEPGAQGGEHKGPRGFQPTVTRSAHHVRDRRLAAAVAEACAHERDWVEKVVRGEADED